MIVLLLLPAIVGERYTSPTQDGQYILNPLKGWGLILTLLTVDDAAALGTSGDALRSARAVYVETAYQPVKVELLYLAGQGPYVYLRRSGETVMIASPPRLVWEVWGRSRDRTSPQEPLDVIGFLDYESGRALGLSELVVQRRP